MDKRSIIGFNKIKSSVSKKNTQVLLNGNFDSILNLLNDKEFIIFLITNKELLNVSKELRILYYFLFIKLSAKKEGKDYINFFITFFIEKEILYYFKLLKLNFNKKDCKKMIILLNSIHNKNYKLVKIYLLLLSFYVNKINYNKFIILLKNNMHIINTELETDKYDFHILLIRNKSKDFFIKYLYKYLKLIYLDINIYDFKKIDSYLLSIR